MQENFARVVKSINKYKGFYIGRYETGDDYSHYRKGYFINPKIVRYNDYLGSLTWYDSYIDLQRLAGKTEKYVETGMTYDSIWDYTLKWFNDTDTRSVYEINEDSGTWGYYYGLNSNNIKYKESADGEELSESYHSSLPTGGITEIIYKGEILRDSPTLSNNIFDMAGNNEEMTKSRGDYYYLTDRRIRGGRKSITTFTYTYLASNKDDAAPYYRESSGYGVRGMLTIK